MVSPDDRPTAPGSPMREDSADGPLSPQDTGADREAPESVEDEHGDTLDLDEEESCPVAEPEEGPLQRENAETSLDQPSEG